MLRGPEAAPLLGPKGARGNGDNGSSFVQAPEEYGYPPDSPRSNSGSESGGDSDTLHHQPNLKRYLMAKCWIMVFEALLIVVCTLCIVWVTQSHILPFLHLQNFATRSCLVQDKHFEIADSTFFSAYRGVARVSYRDDDGLQTSAVAYNRIDGSYSSMGQVIDFLDDFEPGASVSCYVDPRNPYYASLDRVQSVGNEAVVWIVVLSLVGLVILASFINSLRLAVTACRADSSSSLRSSALPDHAHTAKVAKASRTSAPATHDAV